VVTLSRAAIIAIGQVLLRWSGERFPWRWSVVLTWGGLCGALPMVLALSLPRNFGCRDLIISMTFGVAVLSILVQGRSMSALLVRLGIVRKPAERLAFEVPLGRLLATEAALAEIDRLSHRHGASWELLDDLRREYRHTMRKVEQELRELGIDAGAMRNLDIQDLRIRFLGIERDRVLRAFRQGELRTASRDALLADIDERLARLESASPQDA
jgi:monovalent cation:H+ antiporter, CPA1 family